jgi:class 3 adenylate cyclase
MQDKVASFNEAQEFAAIELKIGVHEGACIAATARGMLDFLGAAVNMAARLQSKVEGGKIVLSGMVDGDRPAFRRERPLAGSVVER